jgi:ADP-ribose pyrophosphatase
MTSSELRCAHDGGRGRGRTTAQRRGTLEAASSFGIDSVELPGGTRAELAILRHPGAAAVVPFIDPDHVVLLRQFRHAAGGVIWEVPAGKLDAGEDPALCAARELEEETGFRAGRIERTGEIFTTPGFTDERIHLFSAHELTPGTQAHEAHELIESEVVPLARALEWIERGEIRDAKTIAALYLAARRVGAA